MAIVKFKTTQYAGMFLRQPIQLIQLLQPLLRPNGRQRKQLSVGPPAQWPSSSLRQPNMLECF